MTTTKQPREQVLIRYGGVAAAKKEREQLLASMMSPEGKPEALEGVVVLDASYANFAGIVAASFFAEFGAEVIKIEPPEGDPTRKMTPFGVTVNGVGVPFLMEARNKRYFTLDLRTEEGRKDFVKLAKKADIIIETFPAGQMDSWGTGYRQLSKLNPRLIYIAITPYGQYGKRAEEVARMPDADITAQAASGLAAIIGDPETGEEPYNWPTRAGTWMAWYMAGTQAAIGGALALLFRELSGEGQMVDIATADSYATLAQYPVIAGNTWRKARPRLGRYDFSMCPYGIFKTKDGFVAIAAGRDNDFRALLKILNLFRREVEEEFKTVSDRITDDLRRIDQLTAHLEGATTKLTSDELVTKTINYSLKAVRSKLSGGGIPFVMKVESPSTAMKNLHWYVRKSFQQFEDPKLGKFVLPVNFAKMSETPPRVKWVSCEIGQDNEYIRQKYLSE